MSTSVSHHPILKPGSECPFCGSEWAEDCRMRAFVARKGDTDFDMADIMSRDSCWWVRQTYVESVSNEGNHLEAFIDDPAFEVRKTLWARGAARLSKNLRNSLSEEFG